MLLGTKSVGEKKYGYMIGVATARRYVFTFEAWGPEEHFAKDRKKLEGSVRSMHAR